MATAYKFTLLTGGTTEALDYVDGNNLIDGDFAFVLVSGSLYIYQLDASSGLDEDSPSVISPDANAGTKRWILQRQPTDATIPVGSIVPWIGGYFSNGVNGGFVNVLGNTVSAANSAVNPGGWYVCDGSPVNLSGSSIFNGSGRYLPNLTDDRFLMGDATAGAIGGNNAMSHTHSVTTLSTTSGATTLTSSQIPSHLHSIAMATTGGAGSYIGYSHTQTDTALAASGSTGYTGGGGSHTHSIPSLSTTSGNASLTENRPKYLSCYYLMKVQ